MSTNETSREYQTSETSREYQTSETPREYQTSETPREYQTSETPRNPSGIHQPVVICIDTSESMRDTEDGSMPKYKVIEQMLNEMANMDLSDYDKDNVEICILAFDDDVRTLVDWRPLSSFDGRVNLDVAGTTSLGKAIVTSIDKIRERRHVYAEQGITTRGAQIFVYTDGYTSDDMSKAYEYSQEYLNRAHLTNEMYVILVPPATDPSKMRNLGDTVNIFKAKDCINGLPESFNIQSTIFGWMNNIIDNDDLD